MKEIIRGKKHQYRYLWFDKLTRIYNVVELVKLYEGLRKLVKECRLQPNKSWFWAAPQHWMQHLIFFTEIKKYLNLTRILMGKKSDAIVRCCNTSHGYLLVSFVGWSDQICSSMQCFSYPKLHDVHFDAIYLEEKPSGIYWRPHLCPRRQYCALKYQSANR